MKEEIKNAFNEALSRYKELKNMNISLTFHKDLFFTMRAGVNIYSLFNKRRRYFMNVNIQGRKDVISKLSKDDFIGRFGHELTHIIEYEKMTNLELIVFTLKYVFNKKFRFTVEKRVHTFAANNGFAKELFGVWHTFCAMKDINPRYQEYVKNNCRPDWEDIKEVAKSLGINKEEYISNTYKLT
jgi:hypothetical protein